MSESKEKDPNEWFAMGGVTFQAVNKLGWNPVTLSHRVLKLALLIAITWLPLLVLSLLSGRAWSGQIRFGFLSDIDVQVRFLFTLPLLELAGVTMVMTLAEHVRYFEEQGIIHDEDDGRFQGFLAEVQRLRDSRLAEGLFALIAIGLPIYLRVVLGIGAGDESWERSEAGLTLAGWWQVLVSLPILYFFLLRRAWVFCHWSWFLFRVSRLHLNLSPTHPDHAGGIGFIGRSLLAFSLLVMSLSSLVAAGFGDEILNHGQSLSELKYHVALFVVMALTVLHLPLCPYMPQLIRSRYKGLFEFSKLVHRYDRAFDEKWMSEQDASGGDGMVGHDDIQSLADIGAGFRHASEMRAIPWDRKTFVLLTASAFLPMLPLVGTEIPVTEIVMKLGELLA